MTVRSTWRERVGCIQPSGNFLHYVTLVIHAICSIRCKHTVLVKVLNYDLALVCRLASPRVLAKSKSDTRTTKLSRYLRIDVYDK